MIKLHDNDTDAEIGEISEEDFTAMQENLVEESMDDYSYNIDEAAIASLESSGVDSQLVSILRRALGKRSSIEVRLEFD